MLVMKKTLLLSTLFLFLVFSLAGLSNLNAQVKKGSAPPTDESLLSLVDKNIKTPVQRVVKANGDVYLQRDLNGYFHAALERNSPSDEPGHNHNDALLREFLNRPQPSVATYNNYFKSSRPFKDYFINIENNIDTILSSL